MTTEAQVQPIAAPPFAAAPSAAPWRAHTTLLVLVLAYIMSYIDRQILALMVAPIRADLALSDFEFSLVQGLAFSIFYCVMGLPLGRMADRWNRVRLIAAGIVIWSLATIGCGLSTSFVELFAARLMVGFGEAVLLPAGVSLLVDLYPRERQVRAISIFTMGGTLGGGLAFMVGGRLIDMMNHNAPIFAFLPDGAPWQRVFMLVGLPGLVLAPLLLMLREPAREEMSAEGHVPLARAIGYLWSARAVIGPYFLVCTLLATTSFTGPAWFPTHLIRGHGLTPGEAGFSLGSIHLIAGPIGILGGAFLTEFFARRGFADPHMLTALVSAVIALIGVPAMLVGDVRAALGFWAFVMVGQGLFFGSAMGAVQARLPNQYRALAAAMMMIFMTTVGLAIAAGIVGALSDRLFAGDPRGIGYAMAIVLGAAVVGAIAVAARALGKGVADAPGAVGQPA